MVKRKSGQSYLTDMRGTINWNSAYDDFHEALLDEFISEEQITIEIGTLFDNDAVLSFVTIPHRFYQQEMTETLDTIYLWDDTYTAPHAVATHSLYRPYFLFIPASLDDASWKITRKLHKPVKTGQTEKLYGLIDERVSTSAISAGATEISILRKHDIACLKGRH